MRKTILRVNATCPNDFIRANEQWGCASLMLTCKHHMTRVDRMAPISNNDVTDNNLKKEMRFVSAWSLGSQLGTDQHIWNQATFIVFVYFEMELN